MQRHSTFAGRTRLAYLLMLTSSFFFAAMTACGHAAGERCDWRLPALARAALVFLFAWFIAKLRGVTLLWRATPTLWARSITGSISMLLTFYAITHLHVATVITLTNTFPLWVTILAWPVLKHRPTIGAIAALVSGIIGVVLIERPDQGDFRWASLAALAAALCSALVMLGLHRLRHLDPLVIVVHFSAVATVIVGGYLVVTVANGHPLDLAPLREGSTLFFLAGVGVFGTIGQIAMTAAFRVAMPQRLSVVGLSQVLFAMGFDLLGWNREFTTTMLLGIVLVVAPVAWLLARQQTPVKGSSSEMT